MLPARIGRRAPGFCVASVAICCPGTPPWACGCPSIRCRGPHPPIARSCMRQIPTRHLRSEEHTSELQSRLHLVCRLLLEKKKIQSDSLFLICGRLLCVGASVLECVALA